MPRARLSACATLVLALLAAPPGGRAYESDQYSNRLVAIADAAPLLDARVNQALAEIAARWRGPADRLRFARKVYWRLGGLHWVDRIERWAMESESIEKLPQRKRDSIFDRAPVTATRVNWFFGVGPTLRLAGSLVGTDKLGHFFSQGVKYYASHLLGADEGRVLGRGRFNERWIFGQLTTSVYSNADLVANYEGYLFYRSLFESEVVPGKGPIIAFHDRRAEVLRAFAWSDHVNDYWDEAILPSHVSPGLARYLGRRLPELCDEFRSAPEAFVAVDERELAERYRDLGLKPSPELRIDRVCSPGPPSEAAAGGS